MAETLFVPSLRRLQGDYRQLVHEIDEAEYAEIRFMVNELRNIYVSPCGDVNAEAVSPNIFYFLSAPPKKHTLNDDLKIHHHPPRAAQFCTGVAEGLFYFHNLFFFKNCHLSQKSLQNWPTGSTVPSKNAAER